MGDDLVGAAYGLLVRRSHASQDCEVIRDVVNDDCYGVRSLPEREYGLAVDVGAHIGSFSWLWHQRFPACRIVCIEACPENIPVLRANVGGFAEVVHAACYYGDEPLVLLNSVKPNGTATGGSIVTTAGEGIDRADPRYWLDERPLPRITLEEIIEQYGAIDVLKLDCEGSEYNILENATSLDGISLILGEYHGKARWNNFRAERPDVFSAARFAGWEYRQLSHGNLGSFQYFNRRKCEPVV